MVAQPLSCYCQEKGNKMKILFIEDDESAIQGIKDFCDDCGYSYEHPQFDNALSYIEEYDPDILVLDLKNNDSEGFEGCTILDKAWEYNFRPTCVFSGQIVQSTIEQEKYASPLICFVDKGNDNPVKKFISNIAPYVDCIRNVRKEAHKAMRKSFDFFDLAMKDQVTDSNIIAALCGNRIKAYFDHENSKNDMPIWAQYIYPIMSKEYSTGDIIKLKTLTRGVDYENNFFVILSQSCDIAHKKINHVLLAKCFPIERLLKIDKGNGEIYERTPDELKTIFNTGFLNQLVPLPGIEGVMPDVAVNLKKLTLVKLDELSDKYEKIIALSSPYKERLVWAYMQTACRPGVPDLDIEKWCNSLFPSEDNEDVVLEESVQQTEIADDEVKVVCTA